MLSRLGSNKPRNAFDDIRNVDHDDSEDEDMVRWKNRKNKAKSKSSTTGDKENMKPSNDTNCGVGDIKRSFGDKFEVVPTTVSNHSYNRPDCLSPTKKDILTFEELLKSGKTKLTPIKSSEKSSKKSSPATSAFLSPSGDAHTGSVISTPSVKTPINEEKFSTPPSRSRLNSFRSNLHLSDVKSESKTGSLERDLDNMGSFGHSHPQSKSEETTHVYSSDYESEHSYSNDDKAFRGSVLDSPADLAKQMEIENLFSKVRHNRIKNVEMAFREGCDPYLIDKNGNTMLHVCAQNNLSKMANLCIHFGCDINAFNKKGLTPLDYCDTYNFTAMGDWMVTMGAENGIYEMTIDHK